MEYKEDRSVREIGLMAPRLRLDLKFTFQIYAKKPYYVIEDPIYNHFYRIGLREYKFMSLLDGKTSISKAMEIASRDMGKDALNANEVSQMIHWMLEAQLIQTKTSVHTQRLKKIVEKTEKKVEQRISDVMFAKIPLLDPDRFLEWINPVSRHFFGIFSAIIWLGCCFAAIYLVSSHWNRFSASAEKVLELSNWLWLYIAWIFLKTVHEMAHGLVCKKYNGAVTEMGIMLIVFSPLGYVETSSSWKFPSKWQRIHVSIAGMYAEMFLAFIAVFIWSQTEPGLLQNFTYNMAITAGVSTILFNINPLMRFDGYYIFIDLLERPNLYSRSSSYLLYLAKRYLLGVQSTFPLSSIKERSLLGGYGFLSFVWRMTIYTSLIFGVCALFKGFGILLGLVAFVLWVIVPLARLIQYIFIGKDAEKPGIVRFAVIAICFCTISGLLLTKVFYQENFFAPCVIVHEREEIIRAYCPGFVKEIFVEEKQNVKPGDMLLQLSNPKIEAEWKKIQIEMQLSQIRLRSFEIEKVAAAQVEEEKLASLQKRAKELENYVSSLSIRAGMEGMVVFRKVKESFLESYIKTGEEILKIVVPDSKILISSVDQKDTAHFKNNLQRDVEIKLWGREDTIQAKLFYLAPKGTTEIPHPALCFLAGGPLPVVQAQGKEGGYKLLSPFFTAKLSLPEKAKKTFKAGEIGWIQAKGKEETLLEYAFRILHNWWQDSIEQYNLPF